MIEMRRESPCGVVFVCFVLNKLRVSAWRGCVYLFSTINLSLWSLSRDSGSLFLFKQTKSETPLICLFSSVF